MTMRAHGAVFGLVFLLVLAGCGTATSTSAANSTSTSASSNAGGGYGYGGGGTSSASNTPATSGAATITTKTVAVSGKQETVLADAKGMTLYYFTPDTVTSIACTGGCQQIWPPLLSSGTPTGTGLSGKFTLIKTSAGEQVEYNSPSIVVSVTRRETGLKR